MPCCAESCACLIVARPGSAPAHDLPVVLIFAWCFSCPPHQGECPRSVTTAHAVVLLHPLLEFGRLSPPNLGAIPTESAQPRDRSTRERLDIHDRPLRLKFIEHEL